MIESPDELERLSIEELDQRLWPLIKAAISKPNSPLNRGAEKRYRDNLAGVAWELTKEWREKPAGGFSDFLGLRLALRLHELDAQQQKALYDPHRGARNEEVSVDPATELDDYPEAEPHAHPFDQEAVRRHNEPIEAPSLQGIERVMAYWNVPGASRSSILAFAKLSDAVGTWQPGRSAARELGRGGAATQPAFHADRDWPADTPKKTFEL